VRGSREEWHGQMVHIPLSTFGGTLMCLCGWWLADGIVCGEEFQVWQTLPAMDGPMHLATECPTGATP
jgi:hypothetical protein